MLKRYLPSCTLYPANLALLQRVFDQVCCERAYAAQSLDAEIAATTLLHLFQHGMTNEAALLAEMRRWQQEFIRRAS
ncbi:hypothetical protein DBIPINDM_007722 (plasmid) [Mesorhizobium sp. AR02]|uniref:hypothetical protein n=1 Tax=Mesorhizobium sp. AR02 TaxID=2865837 RepID=UPI00215E2F93|nr:hypothetical protein [Mesorhizobium sp. AR02]UVK49703.1 hypothetical protein DBIPINDM_007722 [Mesorhizobium sp. AR02]